MRSYLPLVGALFMGLSQIHAAVLMGVEPTYINVGAGPDVSYLVIDESDLYSTPLVFAYHYDYDTNNPLTGYSLLTNVAAGSALSVSSTYYTNGGLGNNLDSLTFNSGNTIASAQAPDDSGTYWSYFLSGGLDGDIEPELVGQWNYANYGIDSRIVTPGSWDGWTLASYSSDFTTYSFPPSVTVPEPNTMLLFLLSLASSYLFVRWRISSQNQDS